MKKKYISKNDYNYLKTGSMLWDFWNTLTEEQKISATDSIIMNSSHIIHGSSADFQSLDTSSESPVKKKKRQYRQRLLKENNKSKGSSGKKNVAVKGKKNVTSKVSSRASSNVLMPNRQMQTVPNVTHATHTNSCNPNKISICGTGQGIGRGTLLQSSKFKVQQIKPVKGLGELHVHSHKFQGSKNTKQVTKEDKCGRAEVSGRCYFCAT